MNIIDAKSTFIQNYPKNCRKFLKNSVECVFKGVI